MRRSDMWFATIPFAALTWPPSTRSRNAALRCAVTRPLGQSARARRARRVRREGPCRATMRAVVVPIVEEFRERSPQVVCVEHDNTIEQLAPTGPHPAFADAILPGTLR